MADKKKGKSAKGGGKAGKGAKAAKGAKGPAKQSKAVKPVKSDGKKLAGVKLQEGRPEAPKTKPRLATHYEENVRPELMKKFKYKSAMEAPRITKIVLNMGVGDAIGDAKLLDSALAEMAMIAGQRPAVRKSKKSISNFKLREGVPNGCAVTLRGARMYEFYDRFLNVAIPRIRDFRGVSPRSFDGRGNYSMGVTEQIIFPEIDYDKVAKVRGMDVTFVTTAKTDEEGRELLKLMKMPFRQR